MRRLEGWLGLAEEVACGLFIVGIVVCVFLQVLFRYVLAASLAWTEEMARFLLVWASMTGAAIAFRRQAHFRLDILVHRLAPGSRRVVMLAIWALVAIFAAVLAYQGAILTDRTRDQLSPAMRVPMNYVMLAMPVGGALLLVHSVSLLVGALRSPDGALGEQGGSGH